MSCWVHEEWTQLVCLWVPTRKYEENQLAYVHLCLYAPMFILFHWMTPPSLSNLGNSERYSPQNYIYKY